jgi:hypothetical protein
MHRKLRNHYLRKVRIPIKIGGGPPPGVCFLLVKRLATNKKIDEDL